MSDITLRNRLIRLAHANAELRPFLVPLIEAHGKAANFPADEIGAVTKMKGIPGGDQDQPWAKGEFTQQENAELLKKQEAGQLSDGKADDGPAKVASDDWREQSVNFDVGVFVKEYPVSVRKGHVSIPVLSVDEIERMVKSRKASVVSVNPPSNAKIEKTLRARGVIATDLDQGTASFEIVCGVRMSVPVQIAGGRVAGVRVPSPRDVANAIASGNAVVGSVSIPSTESVELSRRASESLSTELHQEGDPKSHDQNIPSHWYGLPPRTASEKVLRERLVRLAAADPSLRSIILPLLREAADGGREKALKEDADPASHDQNLAETWEKVSGKKVAAGPDPKGRGWKELGLDGNKHSWVWVGRGGDPSFTVTEHSAPLGLYYKLSILLPDGNAVQTVGQKLEKEHWFKRAAALYNAFHSAGGFDLSMQPEKWKRL